MITKRRAPTTMSGPMSVKPIYYSLVRLNDGTIYSTGKDCVIVRKGDTVVVGNDVIQKVLHIPWIRVIEAELDIDSSDPSGYEDVYKKRP
jgi:hypothetical protein